VEEYIAAACRFLPSLVGFVVLVRGSIRRLRK